MIFSVRLFIGNISLSSTMSSFSTVPVIDRFSFLRNVCMQRPLARRLRLIGI